MRDFVAIAWVGLCLWLLRHDLFEREPQEHQAAALHPSSNLHLGEGPGEHAPSRSETFPVDPAANWSDESISRTLAEIHAL